MPHVRRSDLLERDRASGLWTEPGGLYQGVLGLADGLGFLLSCEEVFARGVRRIEVIGPMLEEQALEVFAGFSWG